MRSFPIIVTLALVLASCASQNAQVESRPTPTPLRGRITFAGSTTMQPLIEKLGKQYRNLYPSVDLDIAAGGSVVGINAVHDGSVDIGMASRSLKDNEKSTGMEVFPIAFDVLGIIVHPSNTVRGLSIEQLQKIYTGAITNWNEVGGDDRPIHPVAREVSSGTRGAFDEIVLKEQQMAGTAEIKITAGDVEGTVANDPDAIGYVGFANTGTDVLVLAIDGVKPSPESAQDGSYTLTRPLLLLLGPLSRPLARSFVEYTMSETGQQLVSQDGWVPIQTPAPTPGA